MNTGLLGDPKDTRDHKAEHILGAGEYNPPKEYCLPVGRIYDQGDTMHCVAYATTKIHEIENTIEYERAINFIASKLAEEMEEEGTMTDNGAYLVDGLKAVVKHGSVGDTIYWATGYASINQSLFGIKQRISKGYPILTGLFIDEWKTGKEWEYTGKKKSNGHAVCIVGYDEENIILANSWGETHGDNGRFYIKHKDINHLFTFRILYDKKNMNKLYKDLTDDSWAYEAVKRCKERDIMNGYEDGTFRPDEPITRAEVAQVIYNMSH